MKLITEQISDFSTNIVEESGKKRMYIEGIFLQGGIPNRNKRIYPTDMLAEKVEQYNENFVKKNRAFGELGHPCFWEKTEALTINGWKQIKDVFVGELVLTINQKTKNAEFKPVKEVKILPYKGKMLKFKNRTFDTCVTPDHKFVIETRDGDVELMTAGEIYERWKTNEPKIKKCSILKRSNGVQFNGIDRIDVGGLSIDKDSFCKFLGFYLSEGCTSKRKGRKRSYRIDLFQKCETEDQFKEIDEMLNSIHPEIKFSGREHKRRKNFYTWSSCNVDLAEWLHPIGICYDKHIPNEVVKTLDVVSANHLLEWFVYGDGRLRHCGGKTRWRDVFSTSKQLVEDLSIVASIAGHSYRMYSRIPDKDVMIEGRIIKKENKHELFFLEFYSSRGIYIDNRFLDIEEIDWDDNVYCLTMEDNPTFMAKDGGKSFWTGNCGPNINGDRICMRIVELNRDGDNFIGKAQISSTPMGQIVQSLIEDGSQLGVSSRGMGSLKSKGSGLNEVQSDYRIAAVDVVTDPSAPEAFVNGIMEGVEWVNINDTWVPEYLDEAKKRIHNTSKANLNEAKVKEFVKFMELIKNS